MCGCEILVPGSEAFGVCEGEVQLGDSFMNLGSFVYLGDDATPYLSINLDTDSGRVIAELKVKIKNCPVCGRDL